MTVALHKTKRETRTLLKRSLRYERQGRYVEALGEIGDEWRNENYRPSVESLEPEQGTELLLRFGCLIGYIGHLERTPGAQERSRDILMDARMRAFALNSNLLAAACE